MKLSDLIELGALNTDGVTRRTVKWQEVEFDVLIKNEMSAADFEFIFSVGKRDGSVAESEEAHMARRVHRLARIGSGSEILPYDQAVRMKLSLLLAICDQINSVHGKILVEKDPKA